MNPRTIFRRRTVKFLTELTISSVNSERRSDSAAASPAEQGILLRKGWRAMHSGRWEMSFAEEEIDLLSAS